MELAVLDTREVLLDHVTAKVHDICASKDLAQKIRNEVCEGLSNKAILLILQNETSLIHCVHNSKAYKESKQELGDQLFLKVAQFESELCAQLTGMLLELNNTQILNLLQNDRDLKKAIDRSRKEFLAYAKVGLSCEMVREEKFTLQQLQKVKEKEELGEELYEAVCCLSDSNLAARLTGMLLELDADIVQTLLEDREELKSKLNLALKALGGSPDNANGQFHFSAQKESSCQQDLSSEIKRIHKELRLRSKQLGADQAWDEHCRATEVLQRYATSMQTLAQSHWDNKNLNDSKKCRISWVVQQCRNYFQLGEREKAVDKENRLSKAYFGESTNCTYHSLEDTKTLKLLDVGSCYNPFKTFAIFEVTAIDLAPATQDVYKCDFLRVDIGSNSTFSSGVCQQLQVEYYDVIVFSLLLEYLPSPHQRLLVCAKAFNLLRHNGVLFIITPDSKHATANSKIMKMWRHALAHLGFWRVSYEKQTHLHCMTFRKCCSPSIPQHWVSLQKEKWSSADELMAIPQDFNDPTPERNTGKTTCEEDPRTIIDNFTFLPFEDSFE